MDEQGRAKAQGPTQGKRYVLTQDIIACTAHISLCSIWHISMCHFQQNKSEIIYFLFPCVYFLQCPRRAVSSICRLDLFELKFIQNNFRHNWMLHGLLCLVCHIFSFICQTLSICHILSFICQNLSLYLKMYL